MKKVISFFIIVLFLYANTAKAQVAWNTFQGNLGYDLGRELVMDVTGNIYVTGNSESSWGSPIRAFSGGSHDGYVAKFDPNGNLLWNTFLGGTGRDWCGGIVIDPFDGSIYVSGESESAWGSGITVNPFFAGFGGQDGFIAKLTPTGNIQWVSFIGNIPVASTGVSVVNKNASDLKIYNNNLYITGYYTGPNTSFPGDPWTFTTFIARMNLSGALTGFDHFGTPTSPIGFPRTWGTAIFISTDGIMYVTGGSQISWNTSLWWGSPLENHHGLTDAFLAAFNVSQIFTNTPSHGLLWYTFIGSPAYDEAFDLHVDDNGNVFVSGYSNQSWGTPVNPFSGTRNSFITKYSNTGIRQWNSFVGLNSTTNYVVSSLCPGPNNTIFLSGDFNSNPSVAQFNALSGTLYKNIIPSLASVPYAEGTARGVKYRDGFIYAVGESWFSWGSPVNAHNFPEGPIYGHDMFVAKFTPCTIGTSAGPDENLYFGYAPDQCVTKTATVTYGNGPFTYNWSLNRALLPGETMTGVATASVNVCLLDTAELCVTVTDATGCTATDCAMIFAEDVRCGNGNNQKTTICHNGNTICVDNSALPAHLDHGDYVGPCASFTGNEEIKVPVNTKTGFSIYSNSDKEILKPGFNIYPNPATGDFVISLNLKDDNSRERTIHIINSNGQVVKQINANNQSILKINLKEAGIYLIRLNTGKQLITKKLVVVQ